MKFIIYYDNPINIYLHWTEKKVNSLKLKVVMDRRCSELGLQLEGCPQIHLSTDTQIFLEAKETSS
jgi:hypothetical protein